MPGRNDGDDAPSLDPESPAQDIGLDEDGRKNVEFLWAVAALLRKRGMTNEQIWNAINKFIDR